jgi:hypothetical protein
MGAMARAPAPVHCYRDLIAWQKSMMLAREIYRATEASRELRRTACLPGCGVPPSPSPVRAPKGTSGSPLQTTGSSWATLQAHSWRWRLRFFWQKTWATWTARESGKLQQHTAEVGKTLHGLRDRCETECENLTDPLSPILCFWRYQRPAVGPAPCSSTPEIP